MGTKTGTEKVSRGMFKGKVSIEAPDRAVLQTGKMEINGGRKQYMVNGKEKGGREVTSFERNELVVGGQVRRNGCMNEMSIARRKRGETPFIMSGKSIKTNFRTARPAKTGGV